MALYTLTVELNVQNKKSVLRETEGVTWRPGFAVPVCERYSRTGDVKPLPPHTAVTRLPNVGEHRVSGNGGHGVRVGFVRGARSDAEEAVLRVDGPEFTCRQVTFSTRGRQSERVRALHSPWLSNFIHAMSSPTHSTFQPGRDGFIMARLVLPQALGKAAAT